MVFGSAVRRLREDLVPAKGNERRYALAIFLDSIGDGLFITGTTVFALRVVGLSPQQVGLALSAAGIAGFLGASTLGRVADRFGPRRVMMALCLVDALALISYTLAGSFAAFTVSACLASATGFGKGPAGSALVSAITTAERRIRLRAQVRSLSNLGFTVGAAFAGFALAIDTMPAYYALPIGDAASVLLELLVIGGLPEVRAVATATARRSFTALRNVPFLLTTALNAMLTLHTALINVVVPLWILGPMGAPAPLISGLLMVNTVLVVVFQVRLSRGAESLAGSIRLARWAAAVLVAGCVIAGLSKDLPLLPGVLLIAVSVVLLTVGEMVQSGAAWGLFYGLAPKQAQGEYLAGLEMSLAAQSILGPAFGTWLVLTFGLFGWSALGGVFLGAAVLIGPAAQWTSRRLARLYPPAVEPEELTEAA
ncbi:MFS transporter [Amycolatopsis sp. NPDC049688]|uniref:MFS transporter n=1 Tax=Amycolatopsis sp. NPDC049688 TaxID=3154733 RepID=UPI00342A29E3